MFILDIQNFLLIITLFLFALILSVFLIKYFEWTIFISLFASTISAFFVPNVSTVDVESETTIGSYIRVILISLISFISIIKIVKKWSNRKILIYHPFYLIIPIIIISYISTIYSIDQKITLIRSIIFTLIIIHCISIYIWLDGLMEYKKILEVIYYFSIFFIISNILSLFFLPFKSWWSTDPTRFQGILDQPNSMGADSRNLIFIILWKIQNTKIRYKKFFLFLLAFILFVFILLSGSRTSLITLLLGLGLWFIINKKGLLTIIFTFSLIILLLLFPIIKPSNMLRNDVEDMTDLTGRDEFWSGALLLISERPILGYGFEVGGKIWEDPRFYNPKLTLWSGSSKQSLHNGYLSIAVGIGIPAFILWLLIIFFPLTKIVRKKLIPEIQPFIILILIFIITNFVESTIGANSFLFWLSWTTIIIFYRKFNITNS